MPAVETVGRRKVGTGDGEGQVSNEHALESCQPNHDPVLAAHEAGHVVVRAAFGLPTDFAHVCTHEDGFFPSGARSCQGPLRSGCTGRPTKTRWRLLPGG